VLSHWSEPAWGVALMPAIFDASNVKKVPVRDFDAKRVISLHWNEDVADNRLDQLVAFATTHNWASSDRHDFEALRRLSGHAAAVAEFDRLGVSGLIDEARAALVRATPASYDGPADDQSRVSR